MKTLIASALVLALTSSQAASIAITRADSQAVSQGPAETFTGAVGHQRRQGRL